ncbi:aminoglycoside adenylyltransferase domain-containing protein [Mesobacillus jeotgali]|uniref:aminoglycoside adenylyltransferase domain-containing protein n=1 Tax=Mesobacillus jeotgali TaxID=129985 RepID=UPI001F48A69E|nr:aminoglycoside adenylyltransferase domain-containing protein [Mesobacillus jeotgali]
MEIPMIVEKVLKDYINLFNEHLPETIEGLYIHGSIALNAYDDESSDIDFITLTNRRLTEEDSEALSNIHKTIANKYKKPEMDGVYAIREDIGKLNNTGKYQYYNNGNLLFGDYFNFNPITWWLLKGKGLRILGPEIEDFQFEIQPLELASYVLENMNSYWTNRIQIAENAIDHLVKLPTEEIDFEIEWTVLGLLRQFYTTKELDIVSKTEAGEYGLKQLPVEWHEIIQEAMNIRKGVKAEIFSSELERLESTIRFSKYIINHSNNIDGYKM